MANFFLAFEQDLAIVPVLNKADLPSADPEATAVQMQQARAHHWSVLYGLLYIGGLLLLR